MVCSHQLALCKLHNCQACEYQGRESACPLAKNNEPESPSFAVLIKAYEKSGMAGEDHTKEVVRSVTADLKLVGLSLESRAYDMSRPMFRKLISELEQKKLCGESIRSHLDHFKSICSDGIEQALESEGHTLVKLPVPQYKYEKRPVQEISDRTIRKVEIQMERWLMSGTESDRSAYLMCYFALYCGMRAGDICNAKWDVIKHTNDGIMCVYEARKNRNCIEYGISSKDFIKIESLVGENDEFVIPRHDDRTPRHATRSGRHKGYHSYLRRKVNKALVSCGIGVEYTNQKKLHALRKYFATENAIIYGDEYAARACGDSVKVIRSNYRGSRYGKVA